MAHSYTPGLRVTPFTKLQRRRILPLKGDVTVEVGSTVQRTDVVARTDLPGNVASVNVVNRLGIEAAQLKQYITKNEGDSVERDEIIAETRPLIKWFKSTVKSPISGTIESISTITGQILLRHPPRPVSVTAYVDGMVVEVVPEEGVVVETEGAFIQGIFGVGGEAWGPIKVVSPDAGRVVTPDEIDSSCKGCVLVLGAMAAVDTIQKAIEVKASGVIAGGINADDLKNLLGYDLGVAITGTEDIGITIVVTEGFGKIAIADRTYEILSACEGMVASINGATQIRAGVQRPECIVPSATPVAPSEQSHTGDGGLQVGAQVRIIREPYFGRIGEVTSLPSELQVVESETSVRVLEVRFDDGATVIVPRANVESVMH
jgi:hypothetical protein